MLKNITKLELKINEKIYEFLCDSDAPLIDVKECLFQYLKYIGQIEDQAKTQKADCEKCDDQSTTEEKVCQ